jgi:hypothetical protein
VQTEGTHRVLTWRGGRVHVQEVFISRDRTPEEGHARRNASGSKRKKFIGCD